MCAHHVHTLKSMNEREMSISKVLVKTRNVAPISDFSFCPGVVLPVTQICQFIDGPCSHRY